VKIFIVLTTTPAIAKIPAPMIIFRAFLLPFRFVSEAIRNQPVNEREYSYFSLGHQHVFSWQS
jgi:hypothetical protein